MTKLIPIVLISLVSFSYSNKIDLMGEYQLVKIERWIFTDKGLTFEKSESQSPFTIDFFDGQSSETTKKWFRDFKIESDNYFIQNYYESNDEFTWTFDGKIDWLFGETYSITFFERDINNKIIDSFSVNGDFVIWFNYLISTWEYELGETKYLGKNYWLRTNP